MTDLAAGYLSENVALAGALLGQDHPYVLRLSERQSHVDAYLDRTRSLLKRIASRAKGIPEDVSPALLTYDFYRLGRLKMFYEIGLISQMGGINPYEKVSLPSRIRALQGNKHKDGFYPMEPWFARVYLPGVVSGKQALTAISDHRVPFLYLLAHAPDTDPQDEQEQEAFARQRRKEPYLDETFDILAAIYMNKKIPCEQRLSKFWPHGFDIPTETREELTRCGAMIIDFSRGKFVSSEPRSVTDESVIVAPFKDIPWLVEGRESGGFPFHLLQDLVRGAARIQAQRWYDQAPASPAMNELYAAVAKKTYQDEHGYGSEARNNTHRQINHWLEVIKGTSTELTYPEQFFREEIEKSLETLPEEVAFCMIDHFP